MPEINLLATIPEKQRYFATKSDLPGFRDEIFGLRDRGARLVVVYGIGRRKHTESRPNFIL
ncbi:MAG: hypothetical protein KAR18_06815 [Spirochaetes bacterium]|nr:hypothetical protein [Spirochaetota bacterium]